jgi:hypothetical protein
MFMSPVGLRSEKGCTGYAQQKLDLQTRLLVWEGAPHQQTRNCLKIIKREGEKIGRGWQMGVWHQDRLADRWS